MAKVETKSLYRTKNDLPEATRSQVIELLNQRLADCLDLYSQCKQAHWNVKGPDFIQLHELFDQVASSVNDYADLIAERVVQLGGCAYGTIRLASSRSELAEYPLNAISGREHVEALSNALAAFGKKVRQAIAQTNGWDDADTSDIFTEVSRGLDKHLWFVEAHSQARE